MDQNPPEALRKNFKEQSKVYYGILNPKGETNGTDSTYLEQQQAEQFVKHLPGFDLYINHQTKSSKGEKIKPCGKVLGASIDKEGRIWCAVLPFENQKNGKIAKHLLDHKNDNYKMKSFSMGYDVQLDKEGKAVANRATEVSICVEGARKGTKIKGNIPFEEFLEIGSGKKSSSREYKEKELRSKNQIEQTKNVLTLNQKYNKDKNKDISELDSIITSLNNMQKNNSQQQDEVDGKSFVGRNGSVNIPPPAEQQQQQVQVPVSQNTSTSRFEGIQEPIFDISGGQTISATASGQQQSMIVNSPVQESTGNELPAGTEQIHQQEESGVDALMKDIFPSGLPDDEISNENTTSQDQSKQEEVKIDEKQLENASSEEIKVLLKQLMDQNKNLHKDLQRRDTPDKERLEADKLEIEENLKNFMPFIEKIQEKEGQIRNLKKYESKWKEFQDKLVKNPGMGSLAVSTLLSATASMYNNEVSDRKRKADVLENEYQQKRKMQKLIKMQRDEIEKFKDERRTQQNHQSMFESQQDRVIIPAAASNTSNNITTTSQRKEPQDILNSTFFNAAKRDSEKSMIPRNQAVYQGRANFIAELFNEYGSEDVGMPVVSGQDFNNLF